MIWTIAPAIHKSYRPIFFHEFTDTSAKGHLYRSVLCSSRVLKFTAY